MIQKEIKKNCIRLVKDISGRSSLIQLRRENLENTPEAQLVSDMNMTQIQNRSEAARNFINIFENPVPISQLSHLKHNKLGNLEIKNMHKESLKYYRDENIHF